MKSVKYIQKKGFNNFHKYSFVTESDVVEKIREELARRNVMLIPSVKKRDIREHTNQKGNIEYITTLEVEFTFIDGDSGETISFTSVGEGQDPGDKGPYKAMTGAQKYALMKTFMLPTGDDPESDENVDKSNGDPQEVPVASEKQLRYLKRLLDEEKNRTQKTPMEIVNDLKERFKFDDLRTINTKQASDVIEYLKGGKAS